MASPTLGHLTQTPLQQMEQAEAAAARLAQQNEEASRLLLQQEEAAADLRRQQEADKRQKEEAAAVLRQQEIEGAAAAYRRQQEVEAAAQKQKEEALRLIRQQEEAATALRHQQQEIEAAAAATRCQLEEEEAAAAARRQQDLERALRLQKEAEEAAAATLAREKEEAIEALKRQLREAEEELISVKQTTIPSSPVAVSNPNKIASPMHLPTRQSAPIPSSPAGVSNTNKVASPRAPIPATPTRAPATFPSTPTAARLANSSVPSSSPLGASLPIDPHLLSSSVPPSSPLNASLPIAGPPGLIPGRLDIALLSPPYTVMTTNLTTSSISGKRIAGVDEHCGEEVLFERWKTEIARFYMRNFTLKGANLDPVLDRLAIHCFGPALDSNEPEPKKMKAFLRGKALRMGSSWQCSILKKWASVLKAIESTPAGHRMANWTADQFREHIIALFPTKLSAIKKIFSCVCVKVSWKGFTEPESPAYWFLRSYFANVSYAVYNAKVRGNALAESTQTLFARFNGYTAHPSLDRATLAHIPPAREEGERDEEEEVDFEEAGDETLFGTAPVDGINFNTTSAFGSIMDNAGGL